MSKKKIFISQPMNGLSEEEILRRRAKAIEDLKEYLGNDDFEIIDSFFKDAFREPLPENVKIPQLYYLGRAIGLSSEADLMYILKGHTNAAGCIVESFCANLYGIEVLYEKELEEKKKKVLYSYGDTVEFNCNGQTKIGTVYIIDANGTFEQNEEPSYDIFVKDEDALYKHIRQSCLSKVSS